MNLTPVSLRAALDDDAILGSALPGESWALWRTMLIASRGEPLTDSELCEYRRYTGRNEPPLEPAREFAAVVGRRGGKDKAVAALSTYLATCVNYPALVKGETGTLLIVAADLTQAATQFNYVRGTFADSPLLAPMVERETSDKITLTNGVEIVVRAASFRRLRGLTAIAAIISESAFFYQEGSSNPDVEIINSIRPMLLTTGGALYQISSPYARSGALWELYDKHFGPKGDPSVMVVQGSSVEFNPTLPLRVIEEALAEDRANASAEYLGQFRSDLESFVSLETVQACVEPGVIERPPQRRFEYTGFVDAAGGSGTDSMTLAIGHKEQNVFVLDVVRETRPPFSPEATVEEFSGLLKRYRVTKIASDRYAADWPVEQFKKRGITVEPSEKTTSDNYRELLPLLNTQTIALLDHQRLIDQIAKLERRPGRTGKDTITHRARVGHDDIAAAVAGAAYRAADYNRFESCWGVIGYDGTVTLKGRNDRKNIFGPENNGCHEHPSRRQSGSVSFYKMY